MSVELTDLLPHRPPLVMIDRLVEYGPTSGRAVKRFSRGDYGTWEERVLEPALIEGLAQTVAALYGQQALDASRPLGMGMLVGVTEFEFHRAAVIDQEIALQVQITRQLGDFHLAEGQVWQSGVLIAAGSLSFFAGETPGEA